jgi:hypothetical protein
MRGSEKVSSRSISDVSESEYESESECEDLSAAMHFKTLEMLALMNGTTLEAELEMEWIAKAKAKMRESDIADEEEYWSPRTDIDEDEYAYEFEAEDADDESLTEEDCDVSVLTDAEDLIFTVVEGEEEDAIFDLEL